MKNKPKAPETRKVYADGRPSIPSSNSSVYVGGGDAALLLSLIIVAVIAGLFILIFG